ncbi:GAF domain-containing protein [Parvibium lacunae]|uniref:GAF domain-containing protein n=1 Tax=Parvibium lacunae TaxID=1888893 RepID=A0A368L3I0_9BURK|nr:GAF domain-containing protein [Parvibium lacunae]RCS58085.1 GAF domain-containing protein [Parvibium lacunae]
MQAPLIPDDEASRLAVLRDLLILDTPAEDRLDIITQYATSVFEVPIALVSLVDENRQWFKSACGLDATQTSREISFCGHAILSDHPLIVPDASQDFRFADNPLVTGPPHIRFYMGAPIKIHHKNIGTLCLIDSIPHMVEEHHIQALQDLTKLVKEVILDKALDAGAVALRLPKQS